MDFALANAFQEITLVVFTTLAPAGTIACLVAAIPLLHEGIDEDVRFSVAKSFSIPLVVTTVGLIASATHLGNPSNALYVFTGIGRSPLSNEVAAAVAFLVCMGAFWVASFSRVHHVKLVRVWYGLACAIGLAFIAAVAFAYDVDTILTWSIAYVPMSIACNAMFMGPLLGMLSLRISAWTPGSRMFDRALVVISGLGFACGVIDYALLGNAIMGLGNAFFSVSDVLSCYWLGLGVHIILGVFALVPSIHAARSSVPNATTTLLTVGAIAGFAAIFIMRFLFYLSHLPVGLGV